MSLPSYLPESQRNLDKVAFSKEQDEQEMIELLNYYRHKVGKYLILSLIFSFDFLNIDNQERERVEWLAETEQMKFNVDSMHMTEDEIF